MKLINKFLILTFIIFNFQSWSNADDIKELQIEGISIGDSLLDYYSEDEILKIRQKSQYPNPKYIIYQLHRIKSLDLYEGLNVSIKDNDRNYVIAHIQALIWYYNSNEFKKCSAKQKKIVSDLEVMFSNLEKAEQKYISSLDNKSPVEGTEFYFKNGSVISINCNDWLKNTGLTKNLDIGIATKAFHDFVINEAFNK